MCQKGQFTLQLCPRRWFVRKTYGNYTPKVKIEKSPLIFLPVQTGFLGNYLSKRQVGRVLAKSLLQQPYCLSLSQQANWASFGHPNPKRSPYPDTRSVIDSRLVDAPLDMTLSIVTSIRQPYRCDRIDKILPQMPLHLGVKFYSKKS